MTDPESQRTGAVSRRAALAAAGGTGLGALGIAAAGSALASPDTRAAPAVQAAATGGHGHAPACVLSPEVTEGPYYLDYEMVRRDITEDRPGVPLLLRTTVVDSRTCRPLPRAALDIWHCDAVGVYSGYSSGPPGGPGGPGPAPTGTPTGTPTGMPTGGPPPGGGHQDPDNDLTYLRGVQLTNGHGTAELRTIFPGWYQGRALHIHLKVHVGGRIDRKKKTYEGGHVSHTGQFFFAEDVATQIEKLDPYKSNTAKRVLLNEDGIYKQANSGLLTIRPLFRGNPARGLLATITVGVDPAATPAGV
ncbi:intradiol ring-cleavage dioxygenase [Actinomadura barringtoniae]|uniref:Intradiol ring-cleavage dioxygenase n=1 Tax=Actinomadura barringtoniae TaxID=1427535 RepID=A0A939T695_9ACTN|nr:intradiol ring-cleavage dioxygenase [Actinomadura barringtoniae]MBO2450564.1 intradiol ring-cleavage dioxygenase [Actinomadura barringtoniae]